MSGLLERIVTSKRAELDALRRRTRGEATHRPIDVPSALRDAHSLRIIAEVKPMSPSAGALPTTMDVTERARVYGHSGAAMVSVLCDQPFFGGSYADLERARVAVGDAVPLLAKEFMLDTVQLLRAREAGADAVLLIVRIVSPEELRGLVAACRASSLEPIVEVVSEDELALALDCSARVIGVNARDLDTLAVDVARAERVLASIPADRIAVHFSGVRDPDDIARHARGRADAVLVGEALMRSSDPGELLKRMLACTSK